MQSFIVGRPSVSVPFKIKNLWGESSTGKKFLIICIPDYFSILTIDATPRSCQPWVALLVVARLAFVSQVLRVQADFLIIAVGIIQPYFVVDYFTWLLPTLLTNASVHSHAICYICRSGSAPRLGLVEFLLSHLHTPMVHHAHILQHFQIKVGVPPNAERGDFMPPLSDYISLIRMHLRSDCAHSSYLLYKALYIMQL